MPSPLLACRGTTNNAQREKVHAVPQKLGKTLITSCRFVAATARITSTHTTRIAIVAAVQKRVNSATPGKYNMWPLLQHYCNISQRSETLGDLWDGGRKIRLSVHPCETYLPPPEAPSTCHVIGGVDIAIVFLVLVQRDYEDVSSKAEIFTR